MPDAPTAPHPVLQVIEAELDAQGLEGKERGALGAFLLAFASKVLAARPESDKPQGREAFAAWFQQRWGEPAPEGLPPQYTERNLEEAFDAGRGVVAKAINDQLARARQPLTEKRASKRDPEKAAAASEPFLQIARDAGLPLTEGPSGAWVDEPQLI